MMGGGVWGGFGFGLGVHIWVLGVGCVRGLPDACGGYLVGGDWVVLSSAVA